MKCPRCGKLNPTGAAFCMQCGVPMPQPVPSSTQGAEQGAGGFGRGAQGVGTSAPGVAGAVAPAAAAFQAQNRKGTAFAVAAGIVALACAGVLGAGALGLIRLPGKVSGGGDLMARASIGQPVLQKPAASGPAVVELPAQGMPADVENWLNHLKETERRKQALEAQQTAALAPLLATGSMGLDSPQDVQDLTDPDAPADKIPQRDNRMKALEDDRQPWYDLNDFFMDTKKYPIPAECVGIAQNYSVGLTQLGDVIGDLDSIIKGTNPLSPTVNDDAKRSVGEAQKISKTHEQGIDDSFQKALDGVNDVCKKYNKTPWFTIDVHGGSSGMLGQMYGGG